MKSVLISIHPKWCEKIANGEKTIEVRKTRPKIETPFKCYIYATQGQVKDLFSYNEWIYQNRMKVIGEFECDEITQFGNNFFLPSMLWIEKEACLSGEEICKYIGEKESGFAWHIDNLKIYEEPKNLSEFYKPLRYDCDGIICGTKEEMYNIYKWDCETLFKDKYPNFEFENCDCKNCPKEKDFYRLTRPPQSWCYVEELEEEE